MSIQSLTNSIKNAVDSRINKEARAIRGTISNGMFISGAKSYPYKQAVDCNTFEGNKVWAQLDKSGKAIIVGA